MMRFSRLGFCSSFYVLVFIVMGLSLPVQSIQAHSSSSVTEDSEIRIIRKAGERAGFVGVSGKDDTGSSLPFSVPPSEVETYLKPWQYDQHSDIAPDILIYDSTGKKHPSARDLIGSHPDGLEIRLGMTEHSGTGQIKPQLHIVRTRTSQCEQASAGSSLCDLSAKSLIESVNRIPVQVMGMTGGKSTPLFGLKILPPVNTMMHEGQGKKHNMNPGGDDDQQELIGVSDEHNSDGEPSDISQCEQGAAGSGGSGEGGGERREYRFTPKIAAPLAKAVNYPFATLLGISAYSTSAWLWEVMEDATTSDPVHDLKVAADTQYGRLSKYFGGATVHLNVTRTAFNLQFAQQNTTQYRQSQEFQTYGFILKGEFIKAVRKGARIPEYKGCPDGCLDYPDWENCEVWIAVREAALYDQLERVNPEATSIEFAGTQRDIKPSGWCPCARCDVPEQKVERTFRLSAFETGWSMLFPILGGAIGLLLDVTIYRRTLYQWWVESLVARYLYK